MTSNLILWIVRVALLAGLFSNAFADIIPAGQARYSGTVQLNGDNNHEFHAPGTIAPTDCFTQQHAFPSFTSCASGSVTMLYGHGDGLALANGSTDPLPPVYGVYDPTTSTASGLVSFYFVLTGPALPDVKLDLHAKLSAASTGVANARAEVVVRDESGNAFLDENACASTFYDCAFPSTVNQDYEFDVDLTGGGFQTFLVFNSADGYATDGGSFAASSDPEVTFAPGFDSTGYTLTFSPDPVAAPEPRFFGLLGLALAILLAVRRGHPYRT